MAGVDPPRIPKTAQRCPGCCLILAWVSCLRVGIWLDAQKPIKVLAHGRKAVSLIRAGVERFRHALRWGLDELPDLLILLTTPFSAPGAAESEGVGY